MSKSRKSKTKIHTSPHRTISEPFRTQMRGPLGPLRRMPGVLGRDVFTSRRSFLHDLRAIEDLRHYERPIPNSTKVRQKEYRRDDGTLAGYGPAFVRSRMPSVSPRLRVAFYRPERVLVCQRREARRRVLFALSQGRGNGRPKVWRRARWSAKSHVSCKR